MAIACVCMTVFIYLARGLSVARDVFPDKKGSCVDDYQGAKQPASAVEGVR